MGQDNETINYKLSYLIDSSYANNLESINAQTNFIYSATKKTDFGFKNSPIWFKIDIEKTNKDLLLTLENCHIDSIDIFIYSNNILIKKIYSGDHLPFNTRYLQNNFFNFLVEKGTDKIIIKFKTEGMASFPIKLISFENYFDFYQSYIRYHWLYFGLVFLTIISNLLFYIWLKESIHLYYVFCVLSIGLVTAIDFEYTFQFLWPNTPSLNKYNVGYYGVFMFTILFTEKLLSVKNNLPKLYPVFLFFYFLASLIFILTLVNQYNLAVKILLFTSPMIPITCMLSGILIYFKRRDSVVKFYLLGWGFYFIFMLLYIFTIMGLIPTNTVSANFIPIGSSFEIIFLNLAILSKINILKQEKETLLANQNKMLEENVAKRTFELHQKNNEISAQNEEMQAQQAELKAQRDVLEVQNRLIEEHNILLKGNKDSLEKLVETRTNELKITNQELVDYNNRLEQFAFVTAHNLRGPVATLLGLSQIYNKKDSSDPINLTILEQSNETTKKLDNIIKDLVGILDLQKNSANMGQDINLIALLNDIKNLLSKEISESLVQINHNFENDTTINSVSAYINNIFYNLISNSIKYRKENLTPIINVHYSITSNNEIYF